MTKNLKTHNIITKTPHLTDHTVHNMFIPPQKTGITTIGALGVSMVVMVGTDFISAWWLLLGIPCVMSAIGLESGVEKK